MHGHGGRIFCQKPGAQPFPPAGGPGGVGPLLEAPVHRPQVAVRGGQAQPRGDFPEFNPYGPIWRVVRSTSSSGGGSGSGGTLLGNRTSPRTARVNEDDDDLSL